MPRGYLGRCCNYSWPCSRSYYLRSIGHHLERLGSKLELGWCRSCSRWYWSWVGSWGPIYSRNLKRLIAAAYDLQRSHLCPCVAHLPSLKKSEDRKWSLQKTNLSATRAPISDYMPCSSCLQSRILGPRWIEMTVGWCGPCLRRF